MNAQFHVDATSFSRLINERAAVFKQGRDEAVKQQAGLLAKELIARTQPVSGKVIKKQVTSRGFELRDPEMESLTARRIGERAVEKDRRKKLRGKGMTGAAIKADIEAHKKRVGMAKAGWVPSLVRSGGAAPSRGGWIGRHGSSQGSSVLLSSEGRVVFELINRSSWGNSKYVGDVVTRSLAGRERAMAGDIRRQLDRTIGKGAGKSYK